MVLAQPLYALFPASLSGSTSRMSSLPRLAIWIWRAGLCGEKDGVHENFLFFVCFKLSIEVVKCWQIFKGACNILYFFGLTMGLLSSRHAAQKVEKP
jgi:hypothetical protein